MKNSIRILFVTILSIVVISCGVDKPIADMIIINGVIATVDTTNPSAQAIAVKGGKILAVGKNDEILDHKGDSTEVIDAKNNFVMPGFVDSHAHFLGIGKSKMILDLRGANNFDEVVAIVAEAAENSLPGEWITGRGWHQEKWDPAPIENANGYPFHDQLSAASPRNPVYLSHASGHAIIANAKAMELAGINSSTPNPPGGSIVKDSDGRLTGVFEENAEDLIVDKYEEYRQTLTDEQLRHEKIRAYELASEECLSKGITSFHDAGSSFKEIDLLKNLIDSNKIPVRLNVMLYESNDSLKAKIKDYRLIGYGDNQLTVRSVKKYVDGALGSRGAWLLSPYADDSTNTGLNVTPLSQLKETAQICLDNNLQMNTHAIGDRGNREVLKIYEEAYKSSEGKDLRWRIEHAQHLSNKDIPKFTELGVIAAMQGVHCTSDAVFVPKRLGPYRAKEGAYVWRKLLEAGTIICNGTDAPVEDVSPIASYYASVTRMLSDQSTFYPEQRMTREEALRTYTINGAYAAFEENIKGSITPGKLADIVILSNDLLSCEDLDIPNTQVLTTIVNGKVVYQDKK